MAIVWGAWANRDSNFRQRVGIDLSVSGTTITARYYLETSFNISQSARNLSRTGAISGNVSFAWSSSGGVTEVTAARATRSGTRGTTYSFGASFPLFWGGTASVSGVTITVPALAPSTPATPTVSNITSSSLRVNANGTPAANGASIIEYQYQIATNSAFTSGVASRTTTARSATFTGRAANTTHWARWRARNSVGWSSWSAARQATTAVNAPAAQTNLSISRNSNTSQTASWTRNATTAAPYTGQQLERRDNVNGSWTRIANLNGTVTSYTDTSTVANRRYDYRIRAVNGGGNSSWSSIGSIHTQPAAPTNVQANKSGTTIVVTFNRTSTYAGVSGHEIQDNPGGTGWVTVATVAAGTSQWTHPTPNQSVTHQYRVRTLTSSPALQSAYSTPSLVVQLLAPPNPPSLLNPAAGTYDRDGSTTFTWRHNPVDTTGQEAYELRWRRDGGAWTLLTGTTAQSRVVALGGLSSLIEWQVRTRGEHPSFSGWSPVGAFTLAARPNVSIQSPEPGTLDHSQTGIFWSYFNDDGSPQAQWRAEIRDENGDVLAPAMSGTGTSTLILVAPHILQDQTTYVVAVQARSATGLWSEWDVVEIVTNFPLPVRVDVDASWDRDRAAATLSLSPRTPEEGETAVEYVTVQRRIGDGPWITIADEILPDDTITDPIPAMTGINTYRTISWTSLPSTQQGDDGVLPEWEHIDCPTFINTGEGFVEVGFVPGHQASDTPTIEAVSHHFAGRSRPVAFFGEAETLETVFTGAMFAWTTSRDEWLRLLRLKRLACYRDCQGRRIFGILGLSFSTGSGASTVTISIHETDHTEGIDTSQAKPVEVDE